MLSNYFPFSPRLVSEVLATVIVGKEFVLWIYVNYIREKLKMLCAGFEDFDIFFVSICWWDIKPQFHDVKEIGLVDIIDVDLFSKIVALSLNNLLFSWSRKHLSGFPILKQHLSTSKFII
jgi:hypothetical protein